MRIISPNEFDFEWFEKIEYQRKRRGNQGTRLKKYYKDIVTAFDIETTRIVEIEQSIMYVWQWCFGNECTVVGRTWDEFTSFCEALKDHLKGLYLVVYVHNLAYEFQFLRGIYDFQKDDVFALDPRKILKCSMYGCLEFRCSYIHSNMNLKTFTEKMGAEHSKLSGDEFDYSKKRYPWTRLTRKELQYCTYDVIGLVEALQIEMAHDGDTLYTIPLTSTGYVRRDAKKAMRYTPVGYVKNQLPNYHVYQMLNESFRGGNTHASRFFAGHTLHNVKSCDRSSSYPEVLVNHKFPVGPFYEAGDISPDEVINLIKKRHKAVVMRVRFYNIRLADEYWGCPYLSKDKCRCIEGGAFDNGRILFADYIETTITDVDLRIILDEYDFDSMWPYDVAFARYGYLPPVFVRTINKYYGLKTILKGDDASELDYFRAKAKLNSLYGMCAQNPVKESIIFENGDYSIDSSKTPEELLEEHNKHAFLPYQWGVWCTAWSRWELEEGLKLCGDDFVYCDTDSIKHFGDLDLSKYNANKVKLSTASGAFATDSKGETHYMGVFEDEGEYEEFATLGAKKYCYRYKDGPLKVTISGVIKSKGGAELEAYGGIEAFKPEFTFYDAGGVEAVYNDHPDIKEYKIGKHIIPITSNVVLRESTYTLGVTWEYQSLLKKCAYMLDI